MQFFLTCSVSCDGNSILIIRRDCLTNSRNRTRRNTLFGSSFSRKSRHNSRVELFLQRITRHLHKIINTSRKMYQIIKLINLHFKHCTSNPQISATSIEKEVTVGEFHEQRTTSFDNHPPSSFNPIIRRRTREMNSFNK